MANKNKGKDSNKDKDVLSRYIDHYGIPKDNDDRDKNKKKNNK